MLDGRGWLRVSGLTCLPSLSGPDTTSSILGTAGQTLDDIFKYVKTSDRLAMACESIQWRHIAPTAPDTLCQYNMRLALALVPVLAFLTSVNTRVLSLFLKRPLHHEENPTCALHWKSTAIRNDCQGSRRGSADSSGAHTSIF